MKQPVGVILAGGQARRMGGGDKGLLRLGSSTILGHVVARLEDQVARLALNANGDGARFADLGLPVLPDSIDGFAGPLAGVLAGLDWAAGEGADHVVTAAADTPFFPPDLVPRLLLAAEVEGKPIALARTEDGRHPTFGLWPVALREDLRAALQDGTRKVVAWTDRHGTAMADFPTGRFDPFFNVNTPEDLAQAEAMAKDAL
jgi:molybdopterin-guanine dinucleotide biosynthesis protein A